MYKISMILLLPLVPIAAILESIVRKLNPITTMIDNFRAWGYWWKEL